MGGGLVVDVLLGGGECGGVYGPGVNEQLAGGKYRQVQARVLCGCRAVGGWGGGRER